MGDRRTGNRVTERKAAFKEFWQGNSIGDEAPIATLATRCSYSDP